MWHSDQACQLFMIIIKIHCQPLYTLGSACSTSARQVMLTKQLKQITQTEHNIVKNPNWLEANQLAVCKCGQGFELGATEKQSRYWSEQDSNWGPPDCKSDMLTTRPHCLSTKKFLAYDGKQSI